MPGNPKWKSTIWSCAGAAPPTPSRPWRNTNDATPGPTLYGAFEAGLGRFIDFKRPDFIGRAAALAEQRSGGERRLIALAVDARDADAIGDEPIWNDGKVVGWVTSGGYGHRVGKSIALGYVDKSAADAARFEVELIGERRDAVRLTEPSYDPRGLLLRA